MKLKEKKLRQIIREELLYRKALLEGFWDDMKQELTGDRESKKLVDREPLN